MRPCTVAVIQVRLGSARLPMKSLLALRGKPLIDWVTARLGRCKSLDRVVAALPDGELDDILAEHLEEQGVECCRGPEDDVLARILAAARWAGASEVVRICADNPLIWWEAVDRLVDFYKNTYPDYAYNHIPRNNLWPDGLGAEIVSMQTLESIAGQAALPTQREHCFNYIWDNPAQFRIGTFDPVEKELRRPDVKLDVDTTEDFRRLAGLAVFPDANASEIVRRWDALKTT